MTGILVLSFLFSVKASADQMTLSQAIALARQQSPEIQRADSALNESEWKKIEALSTYLPKLSLNASHLVEKKYVYTDVNFSGTPVSFPGIVPSTTYILSAEYGIFDGFAGTRRFSAAQNFEKASEQDLDWASFKTDRLVTLAYFRALASERLQNVADRNLKTLQDHLHDVNLLKSSGLSTNFDTLKVEVQVSEAESEVMNAKDNAELSLGKLAETIGIDEIPQVTGNLPDLKRELVKPETLQKIESRADLNALALRVEGFQHLAKADGRHWVPKLSLVGNYNYYNNRNDHVDKWDSFRNAYTLGLVLSWNIFDGLRSTAHAHQSIEQKIQAEKSLRISQLKAKQDLNFWSRKFNYFCSVAKSRQTDIGKAKESVRLANEGRRAGTRTNTDLLDAEGELFRAEAGFVSAQLGAIEALINLELSLGKKLYDF